MSVMNGHDINIRRPNKTTEWKEGMLPFLFL